MNIKWLGHSCFVLTESTGTVIVTDPYGKEVGFSMPPVTADAVTVSHKHFDHCNVKAVGGNPKVLDSVGSYEINGVHIAAFLTYHDQENGKKRGENNVFNYRLDGVDVCHLGDIGHLFPDTDPQYKGISSLFLLRDVRERLAGLGFEVVNIDATIIAQAPKLAPYRERMESALAEVLEIPPERVSVKATTEERLGFTGDGSGIAAHAVALLERTGTRLP